MSIHVNVDIDPQGICDKHNILNEAFYSHAVECVGNLATRVGAVPLESGQLTNGWAQAGHSIQWDAYGSNGYDYAGVQFYRGDFVHPITGQAHWDEALPMGILTEMIKSIIV